MPDKQSIFSRVLSARNLTCLMWVCTAVWLILQITVVVAAQDLPQYSDAHRYASLAMECVNCGSWYPMPSQMMAQPDTQSYVCYPGYINLLIILIKLTGTYKSVYWLNIIFNIVIIWSIRVIASGIGGNNTGRICALLYAVMPLGVTTVCESMSELPFMAFAYLSTALLTRKNTSGMVLSGILIAIGQYIRPLSLLFIVPALIYMLLNKYNQRLIIIYSGSILLTAAAIILINRNVSGGYTFLSSSTLGVNMAAGSINFSGTSQETGNDGHTDYNPPLWDKNVLQCDSIYRRHSTEWILDNPGEWLSFSGRKIADQLTVDSHIYLGREHQYLVYDKDDARLKPMILFWLWYPRLYQYTLIAAAICGIWLRRRDMKGADGAILLTFAGSLALAVLTVGAPRYNLPFMPCLIYFAAVTALHFINRIKHHNTIKNN